MDRKLFHPAEGAIPRPRQEREAPGSEARALAFLYLWGWAASRFPAGGGLSPANVKALNRLPLSFMPAALLAFQFMGLGFFPLPGEGRSLTQQQAAPENGLPPGCCSLRGEAYSPSSWSTEAVLEDSLSD